MSKRTVKHQKQARNAIIAAAGKETIRENVRAVEAIRGMVSVFPAPSA